MVDSVVNIMQTLEDELVSSDDARVIEGSVLKDDTVSEEERGALKAALMTPFDVDSYETSRDQLRLLAQSSHVHQYSVALRLAKKSPLSFLEESPVLSASSGLLCRYCDPAYVSSFEKGDDELWLPLLYFLRSEVSDHPDSVREFLAQLYEKYPQKMNILLSKANIHFQDEKILQSSPLYHVVKVEAFIARVQAHEQMNLNLGAPQVIYPWKNEPAPIIDDFSVPLTIRLSNENDDAGKFGQSNASADSKADPNVKIENEVYLDRFDTLQDFSKGVEHEFTHAVYYRHRGASRLGDTLGILTEGLAQYKEARNTLIKKLCFEDHGPIDQAYIDKIYAALKNNTVAVREVHFEGNIFFYFLEQHYGQDGVKRFAKAFLPDQRDESQDPLLEKASIKMTQRGDVDGICMSEWQDKVLKEFKEHALGYIEELKEEQGGGEYRMMIQSCFGMPYRQLVESNERDEIVRMDEKARSRLVDDLTNFVEEFPRSVYAQHARYILGHVAMMQGDFRQARHWFKYGLFSGEAAYASVMSYVLEGNFDHAYQLINHWLQDYPKDTLFWNLKKDVEKTGGARLRKKYKEFYDPARSVSISYFLESELGLRDFFGLFTQ